MGLAWSRRRAKVVVEPIQIIDEMSRVESVEPFLMEIIDELVLAELQAEALNNPLVSDNVSRFLSPKDISNARLASVLFHGAFTPAMQKSNRMRPLTLLASCPVPSCLDHDHHLVPSYVDMLNDSRLPPVATNFNLQQLNLSLGQEVPQRFFLHLGTHVRLLCLNQAYSESTDMSIIRRILFHWTPNLVHLELRPLLYNDSMIVWSVDQDKITLPKQELPSLESLIIATAKTETDPECEQLLTDLIGAAPGLKELRLERGGWATKTALSTLANRENGCAALKTLEVNNLGIEELTILTLAAAGNGLELHEFETSGWNGSEVLASYLEQFIRLRASVLQTLCVEYEKPFLGSTVTLKLPRMEGLETLRITRKSRDVPGQPPAFTLVLQWFETQDLETACPKLKSLQYDEGVSFRHSGVSELTLGSASSPLHVGSATAVESLRLSFPSVIHLTLILQNVNVITDTWLRWTLAWRNLRALRMEVPPVQYIGFMDWTCKDGYDRWNRIYPSNLAELRRNPNFGGNTLTELRELSLTEFGRCLLLSNSKCTHNNSRVRRWN